MKLNDAQFRSLVRSLDYTKQVRFLCALDAKARSIGHDPKGLFWYCLHNDSSTSAIMMLAFNAYKAVAHR